MKLLRKRDTYIDPRLVVWPLYCLGIVPCGNFAEAHRAHFWLHHSSGFPAVCEGVAPDPRETKD